MMKQILVHLFTFVLLIDSSKAQCPYITGALMDAANVGLPSGEAKSEFMAFTTGISALPVNGFSVGYGTTTAATNFTIDGATVTWQTLGGFPTITNSAGTITNITSGSIPANTPVVILNSANTIAYDLATFGSNVYVLVYNNTDPGVSGYSATGNFANKSAPSVLRYFRVTAGACNNVVSYDRNATAFSSTDGAGAKWNAAGTITFANTGSSGAVLPIQLLDFGVTTVGQKVVVSWSTAATSTADQFELQKSADAIVFSSFGMIEAKDNQGDFSQQYVCIDTQVTNGVVFYRLKITDQEAAISYSPIVQFSAAFPTTNLSLVFPNPANNQLFLNANALIKSAIIKDVFGNTFQLVSPLTTQTSMDIANLPKGMYVLHVETEIGVDHIKFVKE